LFNRRLIAHVVAIDHPMVFNRLGAQNVNWIMYALPHGVTDLTKKRVLEHSRSARNYSKMLLAQTSRGIALRPVSASAHVGLPLRLQFLAPG
jgi:hypothetical protein